MRQTTVAVFRTTSGTLIYNLTSQSFCQRNTKTLQLGVACFAAKDQGFLLGALHWGRNPPPDSCGWGGNLISKNTPKKFFARFARALASLAGRDSCIDASDS